jgi:hypothetical protein
LARPREFRCRWQAASTSRGLSVTPEICDEPGQATPCALHPCVEPSIHIIKGMPAPRCLSHQ